MRGPWVCSTVVCYTVPLFLGSGSRGNRFSVAHALRLLLVAGISSALLLSFGEIGTGRARFCAQGGICHLPARGISALNYEQAALRGNLLETLKLSLLLRYRVEAHDLIHVLRVAEM